MIRDMIDALPRPTEPLHDFHGMVSVAPQMEALFELVGRVARSEVSVLFRGETGTGKELAARALHELSGRSEGPFRAINCATLTPELLASELFGHVRGAFTGAIQDRKGLFSLADGGMVFLDEVAEIPPGIQAQLLRVLQEQTFVPLGATDAEAVDVRVVAATNKALRKEVQAGRFREDLLYRVRVVPIFLPRLAEREGDVAALFWHFVDDLGSQSERELESVSPTAAEALLRYDWPGNIRELHNVVSYTLAVGEGPRLELDELPPELRGLPPVDAQRDPGVTGAEEREQLLSALAASGGRKGEAARRLGISRSTLWRKLREHRI